jgi:hypothetical protein
MSTQYLRQGGALDLLTKSELDQSMGHHFDAAIRDYLRGVDFLSFTGNGNGNMFTIPDAPESGYTWSVKLVSAQLSAAGQLSIYLGENNQVAPIGSIASASNGTNNECIATWSANQVVIKDGRVITLYCSAATILNWRISVEQVPTEMQGKL